MNWRKETEAQRKKKIRQDRDGGGRGEGKGVSREEHGRSLTASFCLLPNRRHLKCYAASEPLALWILIGFRPTGFCNLRQVPASRFLRDGKRAQPAQGNKHFHGVARATQPGQRAKLIAVLTLCRVGTTPASIHIQGSTLLPLAYGRGQPANGSGVPGLPDTGVNSGVFAGSLVRSAGLRRNGRSPRWAESQHGARQGARRCLRAVRHQLLPVGEVRHRGRAGLGAPRFLAADSASPPPPRPPVGPLLSDP